MNLRIEPLTRLHDRKKFSCLDETVDSFLREKALQDQERELSRTSVLVQHEVDQKRIIGYHTLTFIQIPQEQIPDDRPKIKRGIPIVLIGQIGVDKEFQGKGYGDRLLIDAQSRAYEIAKKIGIRAMILDARSENLAEWYANRGFVRFPGSMRMVKHINAIRRLFE